jgi:hypothetical protein
LPSRPAIADAGEHAARRLLEAGAKPRGGLRIDRERVAAAAFARYA